MRFGPLLMSSAAWNALNINFAREAFYRAIFISGRALGLIKYLATSSSEL